MIPSFHLTKMNAKGVINTTCLRTRDLQLGYLKKVRMHLFQYPIYRYGKSDHKYGSS